VKPLLCFVLLVLLGSATVAQRTFAAEASANSQTGVLAVSAPPESFFKLVPFADRDVAREFYKKHLDVGGIPVVASGEVADLALQRTYEIVSHILAGRADIVAQMVSNGMYLIIIGKDQLYTDMPEYRHARNPDYLNERVRGTGGKPTSFGEENLLNLPIDRYDDESIGVHEFCHTVDGALRSLDPTWTKRRNETFQHAKEKGLWKNTYAMSNPGEFWAEVCQSYFDCNRLNNWNHGPIGTRELLREYDPESYELANTTFNFTADQDWRYRPLQKQPTVIPPPARFKIPACYTKFTWAREFPVVARSASDEALLQANDTIRKMFAYRHDVLKALIGEGFKLVVLGSSERVKDLPECQSSPSDFRSTSKGSEMGYSRQSKLIVIPEKAILSKAGHEQSSESVVIGLFAKAAYEVTATRPVDPHWDERRDVQQYEMRVKRLDEHFGARINELYASATKKGLWKGTAAGAAPLDYWATGVQLYFDAAGQVKNARKTLNTREDLMSYDPDLYALVNETMAYEGHQDWRFRPAPGRSAGFHPAYPLKCLAPQILECER
jgi:hypothetical protein